MNTTTFHIPLDDDLKKRAFAVIERFGLTPTQAVRLFLTQIAETDNVPLALDDQDHSAEYEKKNHHHASRAGCARRQGNPLRQLRRLHGGTA